MFLEMAFIQKMTLLIGHSVSGVAVTLVGFLFFSGLGSAVSGRMFRSALCQVWFAVICIIVIGVVEIAAVSLLFDRLVSFSRFARHFWAIAIIAPLGFFMGIPFPSALAAVGLYTRPLVPLAWGINGFFRNKLQLPQRVLA